MSAHLYGTYITSMTTNALSKYTLFVLQIVLVLLVASLQHGCASTPQSSADAPPPSPSIPSMGSLSPTSGTVGTTITITGTNFGASQGSSTVTFNGTAATP